MQLTSRPQPAMVSGFNLFELLDLMSRPEAGRQMLLEIHRAGETLKADTAAFEKGQKTHAEAERRLADDQAKLDQALADLREQQKKFEGETESVRETFARRKSELDKREAELKDQAEQQGLWSEQLDSRSKSLDEREAAIAPAEASIAERKAGLDALSDKLRALGFASAA